MPNNGKGSIQKVWDILVDPERGLLATIARIDERADNIEQQLKAHNEVHTKLNDSFSQLQSAHDRQLGAEAADDKRHLRSNALFGFIGAIVGGLMAFLSAAIW